MIHFLLQAYQCVLLVLWTMIAVDPGLPKELSWQQQAPQEYLRIFHGSKQTLVNLHVLDLHPESILIILFDLKNINDDN